MRQLHSKRVEKIGKLHAKRVEKMWNLLRSFWKCRALVVRLWKHCMYGTPINTLEASGEDLKTHSKRVEKIKNYTRNGWKRWTFAERPSINCLKYVLTSSGSTLSKILVSFFFSENYTQNGRRRSGTTLETSGEDQELHSKRVGKTKNYTRNEWRRPRTTPETSVNLRLQKSFRFS